MKKLADEPRKGVCKADDMPKGLASMPFLFLGHEVSLSLRLMLLSGFLWCLKG